MLELSIDIFVMATAEIKESPLLALQLEESADYSQLMVLTRYRDDNRTKVEYLFCKS